MSSAVMELEAGLNGMLGLKPPGVSGSRIKSITELCVANVQVGIYSHILWRWLSPLLTSIIYLV